MIAPRRILFPTDYSAIAEGAFDLAAHVAARYGAALKVLHVRQPSDRTPSSGPDLLPPAEQIDVHFDEIVSGEPAKEITRYAERHECDLIVMATHGRRGLEHLLMGSVATQVIHHAPCPVLVMRTGFTARQQLSGGPVVLPLDFAENNVTAAALAGEAALAMHTELHALHVIEAPLLGTGLGIEILSLYRMAQTERIEAVMKAFVRAADGRHVDMTAHVEPGTPGRHICAFARQLEASLIVMPLNSKSGIERFFIGSTTEAVIRESPCPVLTFGPRAHDRLAGEMDTVRQLKDIRPATLT